MSTRFSQHHGLANLSVHGVAAEYLTQNGDAYDSILIQKILDDPVLLNRLCDLVYQMMLVDVQQQQNRSSNYIQL